MICESYILEHLGTKSFQGLFGAELERKELALQFERPQRHCYLLAWRFDADLSASARRRGMLTWLWPISKRENDIK